MVGRMTAACVTGSLFASLIFKLKNAPGDAVSVGGMDTNWHLAAIKRAELNRV